MKDDDSINGLYLVQLDRWEELLTKVVQSQSDSLCSELRCLRPEQAVNSCAVQLFEYNHRQLEVWVAIELDFLNAVFQSVKEMESTLVFTPESGKETAHRFIDHWGNRAGKVLEAHTDFYALIYPWDECEPEAEEAKEPPVHGTIAAAA